MVTPKEFRQKQADRHYRETVALLSVIRQRMQWHLEQWAVAKDEGEKHWHEELHTRDEEFLLKTKSEYELKQTNCKQSGIKLPDVDFGEMKE